MRIVDVDASYGQKKLSTPDNYIPSFNEPHPHIQTTPPTTNTHNSPVAPQAPQNPNASLPASSSNSLPSIAFHPGHIYNFPPSFRHKEGSRPSSTQITNSPPLNFAPWTMPDHPKKSFAAFNQLPAIGPSSKHVLYCKALSAIPYLVFLQPVLWRFLKFSVHFGLGARNLGPAQPHDIRGHTGICGAPLFFAAPRPISRPPQLKVNYQPTMKISGAC